MPIRTISAEKVLPDELLKQLSEALGGGACCLWVPSRRRINKEARRRAILRLRNEGHSAAAIADRLFTSERTVWRVIAEERARSLPSAPGPRRRQSKPEPERG